MNNKILIILFSLGLICVIGMIWFGELPRPKPVATASVDPDPYTTAPTAVTMTNNIPCYGENNEYNITLSDHVIVEVFEKSSIGNWGHVRVNEVRGCWVDLSLLKFDPDQIASIPTVDILTPQVSSPISSAIPTTIPPAFADTPVVATTTPAKPLLIRWKILSYDCTDGKATGATISLDVSGGIPSTISGGIPNSTLGTDPRYSYSPQLPIYAIPGQFLSLTVYSDTPNQEPSGTIDFMVPNSSDTSQFNCPKLQGNNQLPPPPPTEDPPKTQPPATNPPVVEPPETNLPETDPPSTEPSSTEPPVCYNPQGKIIPCNKH